MVQVRQMLVNPSKYNIKCPYEMNAEFIVVHNTANDASANNEVSYMINNNNKVSFHYAVDDIEIVQGIPENRNAYHASDGSTGNGNRKGLSIEICYSKSGGDRFTKAEENACEFIANKLKEKGWGIDKVKKHQDFSNKYCPHRTLDMGWQRFLNKVQDYLNKLSLPNIQYKTHIQDIGWTDFVNAGEVTGTTGEEKRIEAIIIQGNNGIDIEYRVHIQDIGWSNWIGNGQMAGTTGQCKRIEAIEIHSNVALEVQEHVEEIGWLPKSKGTNIKIGTEGKSLRLEAFRINII